MQYFNSVVFKVKPDKLDTWLAWCKELSTNKKSESEKSLLYEGLDYEFCVSFSLDNEHYVIGTEIGRSSPQKDSSSISQQHRAIREECLAIIGETDLLYYIEPSKS